MDLAAGHLAADRHLWIPSIGEDSDDAAPAEALLQRLRRIPDLTASVMLIGHNPGLQDLALTLAGHGAKRGQCGGSDTPLGLGHLEGDRGTAGPWGRGGVGAWDRGGVGAWDLVNLDAVEWVDPPDDLANETSVWGLHMRSGKPITVENSEQTRGFLDSITRSTAPPEILI